LLSSIYQYADVAYIGGGFGAGVHNILEAAVYGKPVIFGEKFGKSEEAKELIKRNCAVCVHRDSDIANAVVDLHRKNQNNEIALIETNYISESIGATEKIMKSVFE